MIPAVPKSACVETRKSRPWGSTRRCAFFKKLSSKPSKSAGRLDDALACFGAPLKGIAAEYFTVAGNFYQIGGSRWRVDIIASTRQRTSPFETAWSRRADMVLAGMTAPVSLYGIANAGEMFRKPTYLPKTLSAFASIFFLSAPLSLP